MTHLRPMMPKMLLLFFLQHLLLISNVMCKDQGYGVRLDGSIKPIVYDVRLTLSSLRDTVSGLVEIEMQCLKETDVITMHADTNYVKIQHASLQDRLLNSSSSLKHPQVMQHRMIKFKLMTALKQSHVYYLSIWFTTSYSTHKSKGFIRIHDSHYGTWMNTLLENTHARELMPCFDEPRWRSIYKLQLWLHGDFAANDYVALSNTDGMREDWNELLSIWKYLPTPPIPSYLFTIAVGRFKSYCKNDKRLQNNEICIWRFSKVKDWEPMAEHIIDNMARFQQGMLDYLLVDPSARLHVIFLPIKLNGMENYGLLNLKERLWPFEIGSENFVKCLKIMFHEMTHQWFGNLVTVDRWNDIWLSESITSAISMIEPIKYNLQMDLTTEPLVNERWEESIPSIMYTKGAALVNMLHNIIGSEKFQQLLRNYVRIHQFGVASTQDFLNLLKNVTKDYTTVDISEYFSSWLHHGSYPLVFIDYDKSLHQFILSQTVKTKSHTAKWLIPIWIECISDKPNKQLYWISKSSQLVIHLSQITSNNDTACVMFNKDMTVNYQVYPRFRAAEIKYKQ